MKKKPPLKKKKHCCGFETTKIKNKEIINDAFLTSKYYLLYIDMIKKFLFKSSMNEKTKQLYSESFTKNLNETKETLNFGFTKKDFDIYTKKMIKFLNKQYKL